MTPQIRSVPFLALGGLFEQDDLDAAQRVISAATEPAGDFFPLPEENDFQAAFAQHEGARHAIALNSCGTGLDACMMVLGVGPGDEVITTPLTFICTATCALARGAKVVFADIDPHTLCLDPDQVRRKITPRTKAIIPVHFAGLACDVDAFDDLSQETGVPVIYDAAHAVGTKYKGRPIGNSGQASSYSFQSNKNITTLGEGGAVTTDDAEFAEQVRQKKTFGYVYGRPSIRIPSVGFNYRLTKPQLAVGLTQISKAQRVIDQKLANMCKLQAALKDVDELILPVGLEPGHGAHLYVIRTRNIDRGDFASTLKEKYQVGTVHHYPLVWNWDALNGLPYEKTGCEHAVGAAARVVSLPVFPNSTDDDLQYIAWAVKQTIMELR